MGEINKRIMCFLKKDCTFVRNLITIFFMDKNAQNKPKSIFQRVLEDKRAIRKCIQEKGDIQKLAKERGIKFATPLSDN